MLLKIGQRYIETTHVVTWQVSDDNGKRILQGDTSPHDDGYAVYITDPAEIDALLRWLDAQATDIMATEVAPVETPRKFNVGDKVHFWDDADDTGTVLSIEKSAISGQHYYLTTLNPDMPYYDDDLEPAD